MSRMGKLGNLVVVAALGGAAAIWLSYGKTATSSRMEPEGNLQSTLDRAAAENKLVMVDFYTDWCGWCKKFDRQTLTDSRVQQSLSRVLTIRLNAEQEGRGAANTYQVSGYPTIVFLDKHGKVIGRIDGFMEPDPFLAELSDILKRV